VPREQVQAMCEQVPAINAARSPDRLTRPQPRPCHGGDPWGSTQRAVRVPEGQTCSGVDSHSHVSMPWMD